MFLASITLIGELFQSLTFKCLVWLNCSRIKWSRMHGIDCDGNLIGCIKKGNKLVKQRLSRSK